MSISLRIFITYLIFMNCAGYFMINSVLNEIKPAIRQTTEETLVDTANLLAEILRQPLLDKSLGNPKFTHILNAYGARPVGANISGVIKQQVNHRIYVTDNRGVVILDSAGRALGEDYSQWNDVYLTLRGKYGARSTAEAFQGEIASVMYVAAPIFDLQGKIAGVVSVSKPSHSVQPFLDKAMWRLASQSALVIGIGLLAGIVFSWWLSAELRRLKDYAHAVSQGQRAKLPQSRLQSRELTQLADALASMRTELDGKAYIERYVQTLAHEIRCPLTAIRASAELLDGPMTDAQRKRFTGNIESESIRLETLLNKMLNLARLEQQEAIECTQSLNLSTLWCDLFESRAARIQAREINFTNQCAPHLRVTADEFLLRQALANLLDNAIEFTHKGGTITASCETNDNALAIHLHNTGPQIPAFALPRLTERFYSLERPETGRKSTGLGLNFVQEAAKLHHGSLTLENNQTGVIATLTLPR